MLKSMVTVYIRSNCGYSAAVLEKLEELNLSAETKNIADPAVEAELMKLGGMHQVPFLVDETHNAHVYDSRLILHYLDEHYGSGKEKSV